MPHAASVGPVPPGQCTPAPTPVVTFWCPVQILENTPENHPDHSHLRQALEKAEELCSQVNEGVREKENSDRLEWIQAHVQCEGLSEVSPLGGTDHAPSSLPPTAR